MEAEADYGPYYHWAEDGDDVGAWCSYCSEFDEFPMLVCDECDEAWHLACLDPPLWAVPAGDWYCQSCWAEWECESEW